jgi:hypothetical protein
LGFNAIGESKENRRIKGSLCGRRGAFVLLPPLPDQVWSAPRGEVAKSVMLTTHLHLVPVVKKDWRYSSMRMPRLIVGLGSNPVYFIWWIISCTPKDSDEIFQFIYIP